MKIGGGNHGIGIHGTHLGPGVTHPLRGHRRAAAEHPLGGIQRPGPEDPVRHGGRQARRRRRAIREMDCMDCHNRPAHSYDLPERGMDKAMAAGLISASLPFAKKKAVEILKVNYMSRDEAAQKIPAAFAKYYQESVARDLGAAAGRSDARPRKQVLAVWNRNIFPDMKVTWGAYPMNIGHTDFPGCFRCHDDVHKAQDGKSDLAGLQRLPQSAGHGRSRAEDSDGPWRGGDKGQVAPVGSRQHQIFFLRRFQST